MGTRLRKKFKYPEEDDEPEAMDEEEQEQYISRLQSENLETNKYWIHIFLALVFLSLAIFLLTVAVGWAELPRLTILMSITSFLATAYDLVLIPDKQGGNDPLAHFATTHDLELSPLRQYLPILNAILAMVVGITGSYSKAGRGTGHDHWLIAWLPLIIYCIIFTVKRFLIEVDPEELEKSRYGWKGA